MIGRIIAALCVFCTVACNQSQTLEGVCVRVSDKSVFPATLTKDRVATNQNGWRVHTNGWALKLDRDWETPSNVCD